MPGSDCLSGIFVGGQSSRMGGTPKGLLEPPGTGHCVVEHLVSLLVSCHLGDIVLVGRHQAYHDLNLPFVDDAPIGSGPMAGLLGLVDYAAPLGYEFVLAIACDMPGISRTLLQRLQREKRQANALVPRREHWEPLCARYRVSAVQPLLRHLLGEGQSRMMSLLDTIGTGRVELELDASEAKALVDWDSPGDLPEGVCFRGKTWGSREK